MKILKMLKKCFRDNESGFSLAELMVAAGIVGVISVALTRIMTQSTQTQKKVSTDMTINEIYYHVRSILRDEANCTMAFGVNPTFGFNTGQPYAVSTKPRSVVLVSGEPAVTAIAQYRDLSSGGNVYDKDIASYKLNDKIGPAGGTVWLTKMQVSKITTLNAGRGVMTFDMQFDRIDPTLTGPALQSAQKRTYGGRAITKQFSINVDVAGGRVVKCNADLSDYQEEFCKTALLGEWNGSQCVGIRLRDTYAEANKIGLSTDKILATSGLQVGGTTTTYVADAYPSKDLTNGGVGVNTAPTGTGNVDITGTFTTTSGSNAKLNSTSLRFSAAGAVVGTTANTMTLTNDYAVFSDGVQVATDLKVERDIYSTNSSNLGGVIISGTTSAAGYPRLWIRGATYTPLFQGTNAAGATALQVERGYLRTANGGTTGGFTTMNNFATNAATKTVVPNVGWVSDYVTGSFLNSVDDNAVAKLIQAMSNKVANTPLDALSNYMCGKFYVKNKSGANATNTASANGSCVINTPDTNCNSSGSCSQVCIGTDCRTVWPTPDGVCSTSGQCARVCIGTTCKTRWPRLVFGNLNIGYCSWRTYAWNYGYPRVLCAGQEVVRGLQRDSAGTPTYVLCCRHRNEMDAVWSD